MRMDRPCRRRPLSKIWGVRIIADGWRPDRQYDIFIDGELVSQVTDHDPYASQTEESVLDARNCLIGHSLCHAHVHLDKCFLLSDPKYADLEIEKGDFAEAMELTAKAKARFDRDDLLRRGGWLIAESIAAGVTHMRCFVEVDHMVEFRCLDAAIELKELFAGCCHIQICVFAQEPIFSGAHADTTRALISAALSRPAVDVLGTTPYVETTPEAAEQNIDWAMQTALQHDLHLDYHLDYNLDPTRPPLTPRVISKTRQYGWPRRSNPSPSSKTIALGHCTRLTLLSNRELYDLSTALHTLPISFIGLPTSDTYMMAQPPPDTPAADRARATLQIPHLLATYGIYGAIAVNNVGNAFTPQGGVDPLGLASGGVGWYQAGTKMMAELLYECVSARAREAVGLLGGMEGGGFAVGTRADFVVFGEAGAGGRGRRGRKTLQEVVYDPPRERRTVFGGADIRCSGAAD